MVNFWIKFDFWSTNLLSWGYISKKNYSVEVVMSSPLSQEAVCPGFRITEGWKLAPAEKVQILVDQYYWSSILWSTFGLDLDSGQPTYSVEVIFLTKKKKKNLLSWRCYILCSLSRGWELKACSCRKGSGSIWLVILVHYPLVISG